MIQIVDHLHAISKEVFSSKDIFIMERNSDCCVAVSGLVDTLLEEKAMNDDSLSMTDSSYGSESHLLESNEQRMPQKGQTPEESSEVKSASYYAAHLADAVLNFMSASSKIHVPLKGRKQLQLRIALHSGPSLAGVQGLQTVSGLSQVPHFKLMGPAVRHVSSLCCSGLALQTRVSKECKGLLSQDGDFEFERRPDYLSWANSKPIESYWLVGKHNMALKLPSLNLAISSHS